jgi:hypothetical protein
MPKKHPDKLYIGIAEKANKEDFRHYQRILVNAENFPVNNIVSPMEKKWTS